MPKTVTQMLACW